MKTVTYLKQRPCQRQHQQGAVAIMLGLSLLVLFAFMALVFDLGRTYVVRTELQNAADAAALAGAKDLNQRLDGITKAITAAKTIGSQNNTKFSFAGDSGILITDSMISVSSCPYDCAWTQASTITEETAVDKTFLKVDTSVSDSLGTLTTFFAGIAGNTTTRTYGLAVAGRLIVNITPIGVCAIDPATVGGRRPVATGLPDELTEFGFRRGVSYNTFQLGSVSGGSSDTYLLDPIGSHANPCNPANANNVNTAQFVCSGASATISTWPTLVWGNTGVQGMSIQRALNSRFGNTPPAQCIAALATPDTNIRDYPCTSSACPKMQPVDPLALPNTWMDRDLSTPATPDSRQTMDLAAVATGTATKNDYGVLWSYSRAVKAAGSSPNAKADTSATGSFTPNDWASLYPGMTAESSYPGGLTGTSGSPYSASSSHYFRTGGVGSVTHRRVLNLAIADCRVPLGNGSCLAIPIVGIGRFFMQVPADITGSARQLNVEFSGLIDQIPDPVIRLYR